VFRVGSAVTWNVTREDTDNWTTTLLGPEWGQKVQFAEDHHGAGGGPGREVHGVVRSIRVVTCHRQLEDRPGRSPNGRVWVPVPGSGRLREVDVADAWRPEPPDDEPRRSFDGWVVELEVEQDPL
jgi:hypothetical protein